MAVFLFRVLVVFILFSKYLYKQCFKTIIITSDITALLVYLHYGFASPLNIRILVFIIVIKSIAGIYNILARIFRNFHVSTKSTNVVMRT